MTKRYLAKAFLALLIFFTAAGLYHSAAYGFFNPLKFVKGSVGEIKGDRAYENKDYPAAFAEYKKAAEAGSAYGQFMLANMYLAGESVKKDPRQYMYWLRKAAGNGYPPANYLLGMAYLYGDPSLAAEHLKAAAEKEHGASMHMLGIMYANGVGVPKNTEEAVSWFRLAKAQGIAVSDQLLTPRGVEAYFNKSRQVRNQDDLVKDIQQRLIRLGYNPGPADGLYGAKTRAAIIAFQKRNGLPADGLATAALLEALKSASR